MAREKIIESGTFEEVSPWNFVSLTKNLIIIIGYTNDIKKMFRLEMILKSTFWNIVCAGRTSLSHALLAGYFLSEKILIHLKFVLAGIVIL